MKNNIFQEMREQMEPGQEVMEQLQNKLAQKSAKWELSKPLMMSMSFCFLMIVGIAIFPNLSGYSVDEIAVAESAADDSVNFPNAESLFSMIRNAAQDELGEVFLGEFLQGDFFTSKRIIVDEFTGEYELVAVRKKQLDLVISEIGELVLDTDSQRVYTLKSREDLVYIIIEAEGSFYMGRFFAMTHDEQPFLFGDVLKQIYNVSNVNGVAKIVFEKSEIDNTWAGQAVEVPTVIVNKQGELTRLFEIITNLQSIDNETAHEQIAETGTVWNVDTGHGEVASLMRRMRVELESGASIEFSFDPIARQLFQGGFGLYYQLDQETTDWLIKLAQIDMAVGEHSEVGDEREGVE